MTDTHLTKSRADYTNTGRCDGRPHPEVASARPPGGQIAPAAFTCVICRLKVSIVSPRPSANGAGCSVSACPTRTHRTPPKAGLDLLFHDR